MKKFNGEVIIHCEDKTAVKDIAAAIHDQLVGKEDYISSKIGIHMNEETSEVLVWFDDDPIIPEIDFLKGANNND